ncbi:uncharacterized protein LOC115010987 isoform X2 [Cottoperca gobio]|uniref:Uncharacterized protein LOC115010987 isoform X2 n=1 Tax=Cottoperca gobio TaxID=56716 RepID=A0A6J2Q246_COTGO|nr:uncharacterized protein LOC115010987 isoform X2 [Cottoperca gobio]
MGAAGTAVPSSPCGAATSSCMTTAGEFFSPDYLCSNPPLWCNWTIQVDPAKRIHLHLEDLTPDDSCHLKNDQIHMDEPAGHYQGDNVLQKCWREAKYTSSSNTLYVVLLIGGWPSPPYRGFYGRYQAFGPPRVYNPQEGSPETNRKSQASPGLVDFIELVEEAEHPSYDYLTQPSAATTKPPWKPEEAARTEVGEIHHPASRNSSLSTAVPTAPPTAVPTAAASTQGSSRPGRGVAHTPSGPSVSTVPPESPQQRHDGQNQALKPTTSSPTTNVQEASTHREEAAVPEEEKSADGENRMEVGEVSDQLPATSEAPEPEEPHPQPNMVEPLSDHRGQLDLRNDSEVSHLPGDHLFEVAVEVNFSQDAEESWDNLAMSLLLSVEALISKRLEALPTPLSMSSERIKRLSAGVLYILWLQIGQGPGGLQVHRTVHAALQGLIATRIGGRENRKKAMILSVSTADVNECETQLVRCHVNADCVNRFGSYSCRCRPGFQDESPPGSGGTVCAGAAAAAPSS